MENKKIRKEKLNEDISRIMNLDLSKFNYNDLNNLYEILDEFWEEEIKYPIDK
jgi:hypothetical protein